ncbi:RNA-dependent RNA polymerase [Rhizoctonia solani dsRNA virus 3]|uniref:RNA-dependent RNA polymerase n=1 Tax=Rhizoctonia solani dsRNA virus 3 TaxID=1825688 RepID=UPI000B5524D2|nr:RNA-dependent RNA polymerase [Rhizoctonia solani dsRNA virus 3]AMW07365.2 RNA-dependent RNA polymerase [Rhizoctonia solani dsRNA virus 3]
MFYTTISTIKVFLKNLLFSDPHKFVNNFQFIGYASDRIRVSIPYRDEFQYERYQRTVRHALRRNLIGYDAEYIIKEFHHPVANLDFMVDALRKGDLPDHVIPKDEHYSKAFAQAAEMFRPPQLVRPVHFADLRMYKWNWHPNVEEPFYSDADLIRAVSMAAEAGLLPDARMSFGNLRNVVFIKARLFLHQIKRKQITNPATLWPMMKIHVKPALTKVDETKVRIIYGVSKLHVMAQAMFLWPLFNYYINSDDDPLLWGFETILGGMQKLHNIMSIPRLYFQTFVTVDWSGFDLRSVFSLQREVFDVWRTYFDFNNGYIPTKFYRTSVADPDHLEALWEWQREACFKMPFVMPDRTMYNRLFRCIPSGLFSTQFLDSHVNLVMILTILDAMHFDISKIKIYVQGDDSIVMLIFHIPADQHIKFKSDFEVLAKYYFDHVARPEKTDVYETPQGVEVLGYRNYNGYPERDWRKLLAQLLHPRGALSLETLAARCCGIAYASMYRNPEVINVCKDIYNYLTTKRNVVPGELRAQRDIILFGEHEFSIPTDHFPERDEVTRHLRIPYVRTDSDKNDYWPSGHFLSLY